MMEKQLIPAGYKQTEVGVIPEDWDVKSLGELVSISSGESPSKYNFIGDGVPYFKVEQLNNGIKYAEITEYYFESGATVPEGSVIFPKRGASILLNKIRILKRASFMDTNLMTLTTNVDLFNEFLFYFLNFKGLDSVADTTSIPQINNKHIKPFLIPLPVWKEQTAIANALSDVDALIAALEKLINKRSAIKTAAMQQLLTGKKRLPPFDQLNTGYKQTELGEIPGDWEVGFLDDFILALEAGISVNSVESMDAFGHGKSILKTSCVSGGYFLPSEGKGIIPSDVSRAKINPKEGSIIISRMNTPSLVGEIGYVDNDYQDLYLPDRLWQTKFKPSAKLNTRWLAFILSFPPIAKKIKETATGTSDSMKNISKPSLLAISFPCPQPEEQTAIANVLSEMDKDLEALQQRLHKTLQIKLGMMQELLTGKTRLIS